MVIDLLHNIFNRREAITEIVAKDASNFRSVSDVLNKIVHWVLNYKLTTQNIRIKGVSSFYERD